MRVRTYNPGDTAEIMKLFYDTVRTVNLGDYTQAQVEAWAPLHTDRQVWISRLSDQFTYVAEIGGQIVGFGELEKNGHIDCFYCHKDFQRQGIGTQILEQIELQAKSLQISSLFTEASITARPFFEHKGFVVVRRQEVELRGQNFINFLMEKVV